MSPARGSQAVRGIRKSPREEVWKPYIGRQFRTCATTSGREKHGCFISHVAQEINHIAQEENHVAQEINHIVKRRIF